MTHDTAFEHPYVLSDLPEAVRLAWSADCLPTHVLDPEAAADGLALIAAIPKPRASEPTICRSCGMPINPATGECRCSS